jgi:hypothetical protein
VRLGSWASGILTDLVADAARTGERHESYLAVTFDLRRSWGPAPGTTDRAVTGAVPTLETELATLAYAVTSADLTPVRWLDARGLARVLRTAYDPELRLPAVAVGAPPDPPTGPVGPAAVAESWDRLRSDAAHHAVFWVAEWPRSEVATCFLEPLVLMPGVRRALSITAEPLPVARALRDIRRAKVEHAANTAQRARLGQVHDEAAAAEADDVVRRERELADGHSDLRFVGLLAVSAASEPELDDACGRLEQAAAHAQCDLRRLYGQQAQAFAAAALPLTRGLG